MPSTVQLPAMSASGLLAAHQLYAFSSMASMAYCDSFALCAVLAGVYIAYTVSHYADTGFGTTLVPLLNGWLTKANFSYQDLNELLGEVPAIGRLPYSCRYADTQKRRWYTRTLLLCSV
jgi:hypothetical protein